MREFSREQQTEDDKTKFYILTINAADSDPEGNDLERSISDIEELFERGEIEYTVGSWERGEDDGRVHIQAYIIFKDRKYPRWVSARIYRSYVMMSNFKLAKGGIPYCDKPDKPGYIKKAFELGSKPGVTQGRRTDLETVDQAIASNEVRTRDEVNDLRVNVAATKANWVGYRLARAAKERYLQSDRYANCGEQLAWAIHLDHWLNKVNPDNRMVVILIDRVGGHGKTRFTYEYERSNPRKRISYLTSAPKRDMAEAILDETEVCFIDISRARAPYMETVWAFVEELKNGKTMKEKYGSVMSYHPLMHIVVFINEKPQFGPLRHQYSLGGIVGNVGARVEYDEPPEDKPIPLSHDRMLVWDFQEQPLLVAPLLEENREFFPPFTRFDSNWKEYEYIPPEVETSGPEFSSDEAGDGPEPTCLPIGPSFHGNMCRCRECGVTCPRCGAVMSDMDYHVGHSRHCTNERELKCLVNFKGTKLTCDITFDEDDPESDCHLKTFEGCDLDDYWSPRVWPTDIVLNPLFGPTLFSDRADSREIDEVDFIWANSVYPILMNPNNRDVRLDNEGMVNIVNQCFEKWNEIPSSDFYGEEWLASEMYEGQPWQYEPGYAGVSGPALRGYRMPRNCTPTTDSPEDKNYIVLTYKICDMPNDVADECIQCNYLCIPVFTYEGYSETGVDLTRIMYK